MNIKKAFALVTILLLIVTIGCASKQTKEDTSKETKRTTATETTKSDESEKKLVVLSDLFTKPHGLKGLMITETKFTVDMSDGDSVAQAVMLGLVHVCNESDSEEGDTVAVILTAESSSYMAVTKYENVIALVRKEISLSDFFELVTIVKHDGKEEDKTSEN